MSKVNAMQAIREAKYAARMSGPAAKMAAPAPVKPPGNAAPTARQPAGSAGAPEEPARAELAELAEVRCGHRSMNNRSCTRPAGHAEKNHRYS